MLDARQLRYFIAIAEDMHFTRAADRLGIAQSALSTQIQRLEQDFGVLLLNRNKRQPVSLTDAGRLFYAEAVLALRHLERAEEIGKLSAQGVAGIIRLGYVASGATSGILARILRSSRQSNPNVRIQVTPMVTPQQLDAIASGEIDVGIIRPRMRYPSDEIVTKVIQSEQVMVAMSADHPLAQRTGLLRASELKGESFIHPKFSEDDSLGEVLETLGRSGGFEVNLDYCVQDFISAVSLAAAGYGVTVVPESMSVFRQPELCYRQISDFPFSVHLAIASRRREVSPAVREFLTSVA